MVCVDLTELIGECLLKRLSMVGRWRPLFGGGWRGIELDVRRAAVRRICQSPAFLVLFCVGGNNLYIQILKRLRGWW